MSKSRPRSKRRTRADAEPWRRYLWNGRSDPQAIAFAKQVHESQLLRHSAFRKMVAFFELYRACPRAACRRAGRCDESVEIPCFRLFRNTLREAMVPALPALRQRAAEDKLDRDDT